MNNNIKDTTSLVFVKGKNLIDSSKIMFGSAASGTGAYNYYNYSAITDYIPVESGNYYLKLFNPGSGSNAISVFRVVGYDADKNYLWDDTNLDVTERSILVTSTRYLRICFKKGNYQPLSSLQDVINSNPQLETGSQATTYASYVKKRILVKNKDDVFEEFYSEEEEMFQSTEINVSNNYLSGKVRLNKTGNVVVMEIDSLTITNTLPTNTWTTVGTIPTNFRPVYETVRGIGAFDLKIVNLIIHSNGNIEINPRSNSVSGALSLNMSWMASN